MKSEELKLLRDKLQLTQAQMAENVGVSHAMYKRYELGLWPLNKSVKIICEGLAHKTLTQS